MYPQFSFQKNLHLPESGENFILNIVMNKMKLINIPCPLKHGNSVNYNLINSIDNSETKGEVSFLPFDFLKQLSIEHGLINDITSLTELEQKKIYVSYLEKKNVFTKDFFNYAKYKNIPIKYFRKPLLEASLTKTKDSCLVKTEFNNPIENLINNNFMRIETVDLNNVLSRNTDEWMSNQDISNLLIPKLLSLNVNKDHGIYFIQTIDIKNIDNNFNHTYENIICNVDWDAVPKDKRFVLFTILDNSHFTSVIIDRKVILKNSETPKQFAYFFNSGGYNLNDFPRNINYWFIDSSTKVSNACILLTNKNHKSNIRSITLNALCLVLHNKLGVNNFVFNLFTLQNFDSECGIFSSMFIYFFLDFLNNKKNTNRIGITELKHIYFNMISIGCDMIYSMFRGLFYFTKEDLIANKINKETYMQSPYIYTIKNRKFIEYLNIFFKNILICEKICQKIKIDKNQYLESYREYLNKHITKE